MDSPNIPNGARTFPVGVQIIGVSKTLCFEETQDGQCAK
jgi:hypothetical protein